MTPRASVEERLAAALRARADAVEATYQQERFVPSTASRARQAMHAQAARSGTWGGVDLRRAGRSGDHRRRVGGPCRRCPLLRAARGTGRWPGDLLTPGAALDGPVAERYGQTQGGIDGPHGSRLHRPPCSAGVDLDDV